MYKLHMSGQRLEKHQLKFTPKSHIHISLERSSVHSQGGSAQETSFCKQELSETPWTCLQQVSVGSLFSFILRPALVFWFTLNGSSCFCQSLSEDRWSHHHSVETKTPKQEHSFTPICFPLRMVVFGMLGWTTYKIPGGHRLHYVYDLRSRLPKFCQMKIVSNPDLNP